MNSNKKEVTLPFDLAVKLIEQRLRGTETMGSIDILAKHQGKTRLEVLSEMVKKEMENDAQT